MWVFGPITDAALATGNLRASVVRNDGAGDCYFLSLASRMPGTLPIADKAQQLRMSIAEHYRCRRDDTPYHPSASSEQRRAALSKLSSDLANIVETAVEMARTTGESTGDSPIARALQRANGVTIEDVALHRCVAGTYGGTSDDHVAAEVVISRALAAAAHYASAPAPTVHIVVADGSDNVCTHRGPVRTFQYGRFGTKGNSPNCAPRSRHRHRSRGRR